ncbi:hypothetical protein B0A48_06000 [Cryoendolithus antarcticus]|uniref:Uncharacterized protein n=1 Tax=Cryoendolithus antarcticus TaxID=1507870 RepID=A0A1V8TCJ6_9PEZI|nr:hypothetical protein B0A48_06000 [Cryoendolithus antarcticus]
MDTDPPVSPTPLPPLPPSASRPPRNHARSPSIIDADPPVPPTPLPPLHPSAPRPRPRNAAFSPPDLNKALPSPPASPRVPPNPHPPIPPDAPQPIRVDEQVDQDAEFDWLNPALSRRHEEVAWLVQRLHWPAPRPPCPCPPPRPSPGGPPPSTINKVYCDGKDLEKDKTCERATNRWCEISLGA